MKFRFPDDITPEIFERWLWRLAIFGLISPILAAVEAALFFQDRIFFICSGIIGFVIGLMLLRASYTLKANPQRAFLLIKRSFYLLATGGLVEFVHWCWTNPEFFNSALGVLLVVVNLAISFFLLLWIREVIYRQESYRTIEAG